MSSAGERQSLAEGACVPNCSLYPAASALATCRRLVAMLCERLLQLHLVLVSVEDDSVLRLLTRNARCRRMRSKCLHDKATPPCRSCAEAGLGASDW